ncbi:MAG TPA: hypothetical protein DCR93_05945 [Cytophagales bacterium]|nr:hypothetical protein [Cytophagales bacterium]
MNSLKTPNVVPLWLGILAGLTVTMVACNGGAITPQLPEDIVPYQATITQVTDIGDHNNAADIEVVFTGANASVSVESYRIVVAPAQLEADSLEAMAEGLPANRYVQVANIGTTYEQVLTSTLNDVLGNAIQDSIGYQVWIISVATYEENTIFIPSQPSAEFMLVDESIQLTVTTVADGFSANDGLTTDAAGNIYVSNYGNGDGTTVLKITPEGTVTTYAADLTNPLGNYMTAEGILYVVNGLKVTRVNTDGTKNEVATLTGFPSGLTVGESGDLYVTNYNQGLVNKIAVDGTVSVFAQDSRLAGGVGVDFDDSGNLLVGNYNNGRIYSISPSGEVSELAHIEGLATNFALGYIIYYDGYVYGTGIGDQKIFRVSMAGEVEHFAGTGAAGQKDGPLLESTFRNPNGITVDEENQLLYIVDFGRPALRKIDLSELED